MDTDRAAGSVQQELTDRSLLSVAKQAAGVMSYRFLGVILGLASNILFARFLGAELLGVYVLASTVLLVFSLVASFGTVQTLVRFVPVRISRGDDEGAAAVFAFGLRFVVVIGLVCTGVMILSRRFLSESVFEEPLLAQVLPIAAVGVVPATLALYLGGALKALKETARGALCNEVIYKVAKLAIFMALVAFAGLELRGLVWAVSAAYFVSIIAMAAMIMRIRPSLLRGPRSASFDTREVLAFSAAMFFVAFLNYAMGITDRVMLGVLSTSADVGVYNIAFLISSMLATIYMGFNVSFAPMISELYHGGRTEALASLYSSLTRTVIIIVFPAFIWLVGFGDDVLGLFGREFVVGYVPLIVLSLGAVVRCAVGSVGNLLMMSKHQTYNVWNIAGSIALNIGLNMYYIPRYGLLGAAIATAISVAVVSLAGLLEVKILLGLLPYRRSYLKVLAATAITLPAMIYLRSITPPLAHWQYLGLLVVTYGLFLGLIALMGIERDDALILGRLMGKLGASRLARGRKQDR
jgi:O-antigen/teichoic acid export membrane protein